MSVCLRCADLIKMQSPVLFLQLPCTPVDVLFMRIPKCDFNYSVYVYCKHLKSSECLCVCVFLAGAVVIAGGRVKHGLAHCAFAFKTPSSVVGIFIFALFVCGICNVGVVVAPVNK